MTPLAPLNELIDWGGWVAPSGGSDAPPLYATESDRAEGYLTTGRSRTRPLSGVFRSSPFFPLSVSPSRMRRGGTGSLRMVRGSRSVQVLRQQRKSPGRRDGGQVPGRRLTFRTGKSRLQQRPVAEYQFPEDVVRGGFTAQCAGDAPLVGRPAPESSRPSAYERRRSTGPTTPHRRGAHRTRQS